VSNATIREAGLKDAETVAELFTEFNAILGADGLAEHEAFLPENVRVSRDQMASRLQSMQGVELTLLAETPSGAAGLCCLRLVPYIGQDAPYAEVTQLFVRARHQRNGIGAELLRAAEARAQTVGATCVHIITGAINLNAQAFYAAQGYVSDDVVFDKYFSREEAHA
jgi:GNAT superfamily N-acetyltransferase